MSALQTILIELFTSEKDVSKFLSGGARLDWNATAKTLTATRPNRGLEPSEKVTFERAIRSAEYWHGDGEPVEIGRGEMNTRVGVKWKIVKASKPKKQLKAEAQGRLF